MVIHSDTQAEIKEVRDSHVENQGWNNKVLEERILRDNRKDPLNMELLSSGIWRCTAYLGETSDGHNSAQLHSSYILVTGKQVSGRSITDFCIPAIIHDHLFFTCFICLFVEYSILYLPQLNFIWQDDKHVTSADQILLILVPSSKLSMKIIFFIYYANLVTGNLSFFSLVVTAILNRSNYIHSQKIHFPQNSLSE